MSTVREELGAATGYEALSPTGATGVTASLLTPTSGSFENKGANAILFTVESNPIRFTIDGTTVTNSVGHRVDAGQSYEVMGERNCANFRCRDISGASSVKITVFHATRT